MLKPIRGEHKGKQETLVCRHWRSFPPPTAGRSYEELVKAKIDSATLQRHQVWEKVCGLARGMEPETCLRCPHVLLLKPRANLPPELVSLDGRFRTEAMDLPSFQSFGGKRPIQSVRKSGSRHSKQKAGWVKKLHEAEAKDGQG